VKRKLMLKF